MPGVLFFFFVHISVLPACECKRPWMVEQGVSSPGAEVTGGCELPCEGAGN